ncbi:MAG: hypothetical protein LBM74_09605 [Oscillospiraceae bacterium]|jgi:hypothetical protein|nr:hypothetical protein [Oscillospiraceae bacterium]
MKKMGLFTLFLAAILCAGLAYAEAETPDAADCLAAYTDFIVQKQFANGEEWSELEGGRDAFMAGVHDMDGDGLPELFIYNEWLAMYNGGQRVYGYQEGEVVYLGIAGRREGYLETAPGSEFPGVFCYDGNNGWFTCNYYTLADGAIVYEPVWTDAMKGEVEGRVYPEEFLEGDDELVEESRTENDALYAAGKSAIPFEPRSLSDILKNGWE